MMHVRLNNENPLVLPISESRKLQLDKGQVSGEFDLSSFVDPMRCSADMGFIKVQFDFKSRNGKSYRYHSILSPKRLWPGDDRIVTTAYDSFPRNFFTVRTVFDFRSEYRITIEDKGQLSGFFKYTEVNFDLGIGISEVIVRNRFYLGEKSPLLSLASDKGYVTVYYQFPISYFLWRRGPKLFVDDLDPERSPFVHVEAMDVSLSCEASCIDIV